MLKVASEKNVTLFSQHFNFIFTKHFQTALNLVDAEPEVASRKGRLDEALRTAEIMQQQGIHVTRDFVYQMLRDCLKNQNLDCCRRVQSLIVYNGMDSVAVLENHLIRLFTARGSLFEASQAFTKVKKPCDHTWSAVVAAYAKLGQGEIALELYQQMLQSGCRNNIYIYVAVLQACILTSDIDYGMYIHGHIIKSEMHLVADLGSALVNMYAKVGSLDDACEVFYKLPDPSRGSWAAIIAAHAKFGEGEIAFQLFDHMLQSGLESNAYVYVAVLQACIGTLNVEQGKSIHKLINRSGLQTDVIVGSAIIDMYSKCGSLEEARKIFDVLPDRDTMAWNTMIAGYAKSGNMKEARRLFEHFEARNVVTWNSIIEGYAEHDEGFLALECFGSMQHLGLKPDKVTYLSVLKACSSIGSIEKGRNVHRQLVENGLQSDVIVGSTLVDMYAKCGSLGEAHKVFNSLHNRNVVSWAAMITGYAQSGDLILARKCFENMQEEGIAPDEIIFATMLTACAHAGRVDEGWMYLKSMQEDHGIMPSSYHYMCLADLLGRTGHLLQAESLLRLTQPNMIGWISLLSACKTYGSVEQGSHCFEQAIKLDPHHSAAYVMMSGIFSDAQMWHKAEETERLRYSATAYKKPAKAWIEVGNRVHEFIVGDKSHPQIEEIHSTLRRLNKQIKEDGYTPKLDLVLHHISDEEKEEALCGHCEKLAIAFGIISTPSGTTIRATKNLRVCMDCHNANKVISKTEGREIIIRDAFRIHHFKDGLCGCGDYY